MKNRWIIYEDIRMATVWDDYLIKALTGWRYEKFIETINRWKEMGIQDPEGPSYLQLVKQILDSDDIPGCRLLV